MEFYFKKEVKMSVYQMGKLRIIDLSKSLDPATETRRCKLFRFNTVFICREVAEWFAEKEVKCVGFGDGVSIENSKEDVCAFHDVLLARNIVFLEVLKNLDKLERDIFFMSYSPLPIKGLDSSPVRAYAIEGIEEFSS